MLWSMRASLRYYIGRFSKPMSEIAADAQSPLLRQLLLNFFLPEVPGWFAISLLALVADGQMGLLDRGCPGFIDPMEARYRSLGGQVQYKARVNKILVESGTAVGVVLADGAEHRADIIVAAGDAHNAVFQLLGGQYGAAEWEARFREWSLVRPVVMITYGVNASFEGQPHLVQLLFKEPLSVGPQTVPGLAVRFFNYGTVFAPPGKTVVQVMLEVGWEYWSELREKDREAYKAAKEALASEVLRRLEIHFPGLSGSVEMTDVATPQTMWRYTGNYQGAYMGWLPSGKQLMSRIPRTLPGLRNFYMAGQWVSPGGGVPPSIYSGRQLVQVLCHNERRPFVTTSPAAGS
jgi:phytoene dehydrogenase-like protein